MLNINNIEVEDISALQLKKLISENKNNTVLLDVRTDEEFKAGHIPNAIHMPIDKINIDKIYDIYEIDYKSKNINLVVYCRSGIRSLNFLETFITNPSFNNMAKIKLYHLQHGILQWAEEGFELSL